MPDRCASRCSIVTASSISGRSSPSTDRAVVSSPSEPSSIRLTTASAVRPFVPLAIAEPGVDRVGDLMGAIGQPVRLRELDRTGAVDPHDAGEPRALGQRVDGVLQGLHTAHSIEAHHPPRVPPPWAAVTVSSRRLCTRSQRWASRLGGVAEWLGRGLQSLAHRFDSGPRLEGSGRLAQGESASLTRKRSEVQIL